ncbi:acetyl-CoA carboxylase biotin carboxyl carrier protein [Lactiplantibacillus herbarum]|uniref:acetyl-CoA carboxylase biotin carboxyl carrier protein n=1 Tax=Lactiplantibacillus herbarum TaxID=1670446 RepID=UPI00064F8C66|nr:biotin/lipoyl-containing protein [Lactiplantibacillus herbarum]
MELEKIYQLMDKFEQSSLTSFEYHDKDFGVQFGKKGHGRPADAGQIVPLPSEPVVTPEPIAPTPVSVASAPEVEPVVETRVTSAAPVIPVVSEAPAESMSAPKPEPIDPKECVTAPVVGIYYPAHSAAEAPYVSIGDHVSAGQQVGLIQAMQMMRPVVAKQAGTVKSFLVKNGEEVNFGQPLIQLILDAPDDI